MVDEQWKKNFEDCKAFFLEMGIEMIAVERVTDEIKADEIKGDVNGSWSYDDESIVTKDSSFIKQINFFPETLNTYDERPSYRNPYIFIEINGKKITDLCEYDNRDLLRIEQVAKKYKINIDVEYFKKELEEIKQNEYCLNCERKHCYTYNDKETCKHV